HFLSTTNDVISVSGYLAGDHLIPHRISRPSPIVIFPARPLPSLNDIVVRDITPNYVRFDTASHNIESLRASKAKGGFAYFTGYVTDIEPNLSFDDSTIPHSYGGILDSTDLGPALTQTAGSVEWKGQLSFSDHYGAAGIHRPIGGIYRQNNDFTLIIEFNATGGKVSGFAANIDSGVPGAIIPGDPNNTGLDIYLEGTFDKNGAISGKSLHYEFASDEYAGNLDTEIARLALLSRGQRGERIGDLSGLIGSHGAVGVFQRENAEGDGGGGFIVAPPASVSRTILEDYEAWQASFDSAPATTITSAENRFLSDSDTVFANLTTEPNGAGTTAPVTTLNLSTTLYNGNALAGRTGNSVSFANGYFNDAGNTTRSFHATIDATADLGATLPVWQAGQTVTAVWKGVFAARVGNGTQTNADFDLTVDFRNRQIWAEVPVVADPRLVYRLSGVFPVDLDGVIIGTVIRTDTVSGNENPFGRLPEDPYPPAILNGLIGEHGAIGVFISGSRADNVSVLTDGTGDAGYVGGFVACPYAGNQCSSR
nr:hypothetical protein [Pseudomonadota bacterium]